MCLECKSAHLDRRSFIRMAGIGATAALAGFGSVMPVLASDAASALSPDEALAIESLSIFAADRGHLRHRPGPKDAAMRKARVCYDHLAGDLGVQMFDSLAARRHLAVDDNEIGLTGDGERFVSELGIDLATLRKSRRPLCRCCLDWSERRNHLAGSLGAALFDMILERGWARRDGKSRAVAFSHNGETAFRALFPVDAKAVSG